MLQSMTGFGKATYEDEQVWIQIEIRSINSKYADINLQAPKFFLEYTQRWKNLVITHLDRGKIDVNLQVFYKPSTTLPSTIQEPLFKAYYDTLEKLATAVGASTHTIFELALKSPGVITTTPEKDKKEPDYDPTIQKKIETILEQALTNCKHTRIEEGNTLTKCMTEYLQQIQLSLSAIEQIDTSRIDTFKQRILDKLATILPQLPVDNSRLEQEIVYYLDKIDITEEKVRLATHLAYFLSVMESQTPVGKQLGFIAQEINREINTLGVKSNDAIIQKHIITMKNELEKIKEQLQNIL